MHGCFPQNSHESSGSLTLCDGRLHKHRDTIAERYPEHNRWRGTSQASTFLAGLQPFVAYFGLIACLVIVLVFTTATWWDTPADFKKVAVAYGAVSGFALSIRRKTLTSGI